MNKVKKAIIWSFIEKFGVQAIGLLIGIILARLLSPTDYGLIGMTTIFIAITNVFIEAGFSNALIRKTDRDESDLSTAFYFNLSVGIVMYTILYLTAPTIAKYFNENILCNLIRIVGLNVIFNSLCIVQNAILTAELRIKEQTIIQLLSQMPIGIIVIYLAYQGLGVYVLAIQALGSSILSTFLLWIYAKWRPKLIFSQKSMTYLWNFGSNVIGANLIGTFFNEIYSFLIGKYIGKKDLGLYSKGRSLAMYPNVILIGILQKIAIPILSKYQTSANEMKNMYRKFICLSLALMCLISGWLIVIADPLIKVLWGNQWIESIWIFQCILTMSVFSPAVTLNLLLAQILNKTSYILKLEYIKKPTAIIIIIISIPYGIEGLLLAQFIIGIFEMALNSFIPKQFIKYNYKQQIYDIFLYLYPLCIASTISIFILSLIENHLFIQLIIGSFSFFTIFSFIIIIRRDLFILPYITAFYEKKIKKYII